MSASLVENEWNFRIIEKRLVLVKSKNEATRIIVALDFHTNMVFTVEAAAAVDMEDITLDCEYLFTINVYTAKNLDDVEKNFIGFFEAVDVDQEMEDFIKANLIYPDKIHFELVEVEEP